MTSDNVSLNSNTRTSLNSIQNNSNEIDEKSEELSSGQDVNSPEDNPTNFFIAQSLLASSASSLEENDELLQGELALETAQIGAEAINGYFDQLTAIANSALTESNPENRAALGEQFNVVLGQIEGIAKDSNIGGTNLLQGSQQIELPGGISLSGNDINDENGLSLNIEGESYNISDSVDFSSPNYQEDISNLIGSIESANEALNTAVSAQASDLASIALREEFNENKANIEEAGAAKLTESDLYEDAAELLSLQLSQQIATEVVSLSNEQTQDSLKQLL